MKLTLSEQSSQKIQIDRVKKINDTVSYKIIRKCPVRIVLSL